MLETLEQQPWNEMVIDYLRIAAEKDADNALALMHRAVFINPDFYYAWYVNGMIMRKRGLNQEAIDALHSATRFNKEFIPAWIELGLAYRSAESMRDALKAFTMAYDLDAVNSHLEELVSSTKNAIDSEQGPRILYMRTDDGMAGIAGTTGTWNDIKTREHMEMHQYGIDSLDVKAGVDVRFVDTRTRMLTLTIEHDFSAQLRVISIDLDKSGETKTDRITLLPGLISADPQDTLKPSRVKVMESGLRRDMFDVHVDGKLKDIDHASGVAAIIEIDVPNHPLRRAAIMIPLER
nr:hypothetical protein [Candidatus Sigynarchaeota archaeon]